MINIVQGPHSAILSTMSNDEIANEGMALTQMCAMTAMGRQQIRGMLDAFHGDVPRQNEVGGLLLESIFRHTCASMVYACMPTPSMEVMDALEPSDMDILRQRAQGVVAAMHSFGLPEAFIEDFSQNNIPLIMDKYAAVIQTVKNIKERSETFSVTEREKLLQSAFESGEPQGAKSNEPAGGTASSDGAVSH